MKVISFIQNYAFPISLIATLILLGVAGILIYKAIRHRMQATQEKLNIAEKDLKATQLDLQERTRQRDELIKQVDKFKILSVILSSIFTGFTTIAVSSTGLELVKQLTPDASLKRQIGSLKDQIEQDKSVISKKDVELGALKQEQVFCKQKQQELLLCERELAQRRGAQNRPSKERNR